MPSLTNLLKSKKNAFKNSLSLEKTDGVCYDEEDLCATEPLPVPVPEPLPVPVPEPTPLLTLYYRVFTDTDDPNENVLNSASAMDIFSSPFPGPGCSIRALSDQSGKQIKDGNKNSILWEGVRLAVTHPENTTITNAVYQERFVINNNDNSISGIAVYEDSGSGVTTSVSKNTFMVTGAIGETCVGATRCIIEYDNKGKASWNTSEVKYMRRLQFF